MFIDIAELYKHTNLALKIEKIKKYPSTERDWTITLDKKFEIDKIFESVDVLETKFLEKFKLIDIFESEKIGKDKINATFKFIFRDLEKTISFDEAEGEFSRITDLISKKLC